MGRNEPLLFTGADKKLRRQELLLEHVLKTGYISVEEISRQFGVTVQTARRDLADLLGSGKVRRCHGGMTAAVPFDATSRRIRRGQNIAAKRRIAETVAGLVPDHASVYLASGSTLEVVAEVLAGSRHDLTVATASARIAVELSEREDFTVRIPGGIVRGGDNFIVGESVIRWLSEQRFDVMITTVEGIAENGDITLDSADEVPIVAAAAAVSRRIILAVDSTKLDYRGPEPLMNIRDVTDIVTDGRPSKALSARILANKVQLHAL